MLDYTVLSESTTRESHLKTDVPIQHKMWYLFSNGTFYYVSWLSLAPEGERPECMAFECDERGRVKNWDELAASYSADSRVALSEILEQLFCNETA